MVNLPIITYPLDKLGTSPTNRIVGEIRSITNTRERAFVPAAGPFYTESMVLTNTETGEVLRPVDDYVLCQPFQQAALRTGKDVQCVVLLKTNVPIIVSMDYQVVGGEYSWNMNALIDLINTLDLDERPVKWGSLVGRPLAYPAAPHIHDIGDTYGWEYVVFQLESIRNAILVGDEASHDELRMQMQTIRDDLETEIRAVDARLFTHVSDKANPHAVTKAQVGLGLVEDFPPATSAEALAGELPTRYMTPATTTLLIAKLVKEAVDTHIADKTNPHNVTKAQVGLGNVLNYGTASSAEGVSGTATDKYMTASVTKAAIAAQVGDAYVLHAANVSNPHSVTKAQVGLGSVDNYSTATKTEAEAGTLSTRFMTPLRTKEAITFQAGALLNTHVSNLNNPHAVTKKQVGLSNIPNEVSRERNVNSSATLLLAGAMHDHILAGDHDSRYVMVNSSVSTSLREVSGTLQAYIGGVWRQIWPAQWS